MKALGIFIASVLLLAGCSLQNVDEGKVPSVQASPSASDQPVEVTPQFELSLLGEDPDLCKLKENSRLRNANTPIVSYEGKKDIKGQYPGNATAFPFSPTALPVNGVLRVVAIPVDWGDSPGNATELEFYKEQLSIFEEFWYMVSEGKLDIELEVPDQWFRMKGSVHDFEMTEEEEGQQYEFRPKKQYLYDEIIRVSDSSIDFTDVDIVLPMWPLDETVSQDGGPHEFNFDWNAAMYTNEGTIYNIAGAGDFYLDHINYGGPWFFWAHEVGHMLGIVHLNDESHVLEKKFEFNEYFWQTAGTNGFDIMGNQDGAVKTIGAWLRWLAGWLEDDQVVCLDSSTIVDEYFALKHLNDISGEKEAVVIKLTETQVVVIESRRWDSRFDREIVHSRDGLVAYVVDVTKAASENSQMMLSPRSITNWLEVSHWRGSEELDANFCEGDSAQVGDIMIEAAAITGDVDYVRVYKTEGWVDPSGPPAGSVTGRVNRIENGCVFGPGADG